MQIPILSGIYTDNDGDVRTSYPVNMMPIPQQSGVSAGYLRPADGIVNFTTGPGVDRAGINWDGICYRVMGSKLVLVSELGVVTEIGDVGDNGKYATLDYSFDDLIIASNNNLFFYDGTTLTQSTDPDLDVVIDAIWVDGYVMTTDGEFIVVNDLSNKFSINPFKYGSAEADPDPIKALIKLRNEPYALNRYTTQAFRNVGGDANQFPFDTIDGAQLQRGTVGTHTCCLFMENIAFLGGGRNEPLAVWLGANGQTAKISTREIDKHINEYRESELENALVESIYDGNRQLLYIHLPDTTFVYDDSSSRILGEPVWYALTSSSNLESGLSIYRARNHVWCYDRWLVGDTNIGQVGYLDESRSSHWGNTIAWEFGTRILYNESMRAIVHDLELIGLPGRSKIGDDTSIETRHSADGVEWSTPRFINSGTNGFRTKRIKWFMQGHMRNMRMQRFRGTSEAHLSVMRLEANLEGLGV